MTGDDRRWLEVSARCPEAGEAESLVAWALIEIGGRAVQERDGWQVTHLDANAEDAIPEEEVRARLVEATGLETLEVSTAWQSHADWAEAWKRGLHARRITRRLVVRPSWVIFEPGPDDLVIVLDPGMAFGTAEHGTTRGCLRLLDRVVSPGDRVLDIGAGSGILAVAAAMLGAQDVLAVEGDPLACEALDENVAFNHVEDRVRRLTEWADPDRLREWGPVDGVVANIETGTLRPLLVGFRDALHPDGWMVLSGILESEWPSMRASCEEAGFRFEVVDEDGEWRAGLFRKGV